MVTPWPRRSFRQGSRDSASMPGAKWPGPVAPCGGNWSPLGGFGQESKQDAGLSRLEENVTAGFLADDRQAQNRPVEGFRRSEVIDVDGSFDHGPDCQDSLHPGWSFG